MLAASQLPLASCIAILVAPLEMEFSLLLCRVADGRLSLVTKVEVALARLSLWQTSKACPMVRTTRIAWLWSSMSSKLMLLRRPEVLAKSFCESHFAPPLTRALVPCITFRAALVEIQPMFASQPLSTSGSRKEIFLTALFVCTADSFS